MPFNANASSITLSGNIATGNLVNGFAVAGHIGGQVTWDGDDNFPFVVWDDVIVDTGARLTLAAGAVLKFRDFYRTLWVDGALVAQTDAANPILFTSLRDDAVGGDTNGDGTATVPAPNDWDSVRFGVGSAGSVLDHAILRYGGGDWSEIVYVATPNITLRNNTVRIRARTGSGWTTSSRPR